MDQDILAELMCSAWVVAPTASVIYDRGGKSVLINTSGRRLFNYEIEDIPSVQEHYNLFNDQTLVRENLIPLVREAFAGKKITLPALDYPVLDRFARPTDRSLRLQIAVAPLRTREGIGEYVVCYFTDLSEKAALESELTQQQEELQRVEEQQNRLREEIEARSAPVVPVLAGILVLPLIGAIDSLRAQQIMSSALEASAEHSADILILDITGVPVVDTQVANYLLQAIRALRLVGTETILVGISPEIAQTVIQLGLRLEDITTRADLQSGLQTALARQGLAVTRVEKKRAEDG